MKNKLLELLACPRCGSELKLRDPVADEDIKAGVLVCASGHGLEIRDGVPRLTSDTAPAESIRQTYDTAWSQFEYGDAVWSRDTGVRIQLFLDEVRLKREDLEGKLVLDAGCGTGILTHGVTTFGCEAVGTDVSEIVVRAQRHFNADGTGRAHFVQADIDKPPFRDGVFDIIYAGGVLHCNPDPHATFDAIARKLKPGGRMWVWLYRKRTDLKYRLQQTLRAVIQRLPAPLQKAAVALWLPQAMLRQHLKIAFGRCPPEDRRSWRERYVLLLDHYTPEYRWEHTEEQVRAWYRQAGFDDLAFTYNDWGFGVIGTKLPGSPATA
jgi:SAM-dependent methyltransferase